jgi:lysozyme
MTIGTNLSGIDVSHYQGTVDWPAVKSNSIGFAFAKATQGTTMVDSQFSTNWANMKAAGLLRGAYHFFDSSCDPTAQANHFLATIGSLDATDLPPVLDIESFSGAYGTTDLPTNVQTWLNIVGQSQGRKPMIYTGTSFWNKYMNDQFGGYPLWIAEYGVSQPTLPNGWTAWTFWQSSQTGIVPGVSGNVDMDSYAGSYEGLLAFLQTP